MQDVVITAFVEGDARTSARSWFRVYAQKKIGGRPMAVGDKSNAPILMMACVRCGCLTSIDDAHVDWSGLRIFQVGQELWPVADA